MSNFQRIVVILGFLFFSLIHIHAQQHVLLDSLNLELAKTSKGAQRANILCKLAWEMKNLDIQLAEIYLNEALSISEPIGHKPGLAEIYKIMGVLEWYRGEYTKAKENLEKALVYYKQLKDNKGIANIHNNLGLLSQTTSQFPKAMEHLKFSLDIREAIFDSAGIATSCNNLGVIYEDMGDYSQALKYYTRALTLFEKMGDTGNAPSSHINVGNIYHAIGKADLALENFQAALTSHEMSKNLRGMGDAYINIGEVFSEKGDYKQALINYEKARDISETLQDEISEAEILTSIGKMHYLAGDLIKAERKYFAALEISLKKDAKAVTVELYNLLGGLANERNQPKLALTYLDKGAQLGKEIQALPELEKSYESLTRSYGLMGDYKKALESQTKMVEVKASLFTESMTEQSAEMAAKYELTQKENDIAHLEQVNTLSDQKYEEEHSKNLLLLLGLSLAGMLALVLYAFYHRKKKDNELIEAQNDQLAAKNDELEALNEEKNTLMGIVSHDLKNPLSQIKGLANIVLTEPENLSPKQHMMVGKIGESSDRLTEMIKKILDVEAIESSKLNLQMCKTDLNAMIRQTLDEYKLDAERKDIELSFDATYNEEFVVIDPEFTQQIFGNLISNAVKYTPQHRKIFVQLKSTENEVQFRVKDQGPGLTEEDRKKLFGRFQRLSAQPTGGEHSNGLGLSIVKKYVDAMEGKVWCESIPGHGATFVVEFPKN